MSIAKPVSTSPRGTRGIVFLALGMAVAFWLGLALVTRTGIGEIFGTRVDFTPSLVAARVFREGGSPYTDAVTARVQETMFGARLNADEDQQRVAHPAYTALLLLPFTLVDNETAIALWSALQLTLLIATPVLWMNIVGWSPRPWWVAGIVAACLFLLRFPMIVYVLGQFVGTILFGFSLSIWALRRGQPTLAGAALVLCMMPPSFGVFLVLLVLLPEIARGRWRAALVFAGLMSLFTLLTIVRIGWWIPDWLATLVAYRDYANAYFPPAILPLPLQVALAVGALAISAWAVRRWWLEEGDTRWQDALCATLLTLLLLLPQTGSYYLSALMIVAVIALSRISRSRRARAQGVALWLACMALPWLLFLIFQEGRVEVLMMPLALAALYAFSRMLGAGHR